MFYVFIQPKEFMFELFKKILKVGKLFINPNNQV